MIHSLISKFNHRKFDHYINEFVILPRYHVTAHRYISRLQLEIVISMNLNILPESVWAIDNNFLERFYSWWTVQRSQLQKIYNFLLEFWVAQLEVFCTRHFILQFLSNTIDDVFHFKGKTNHRYMLHKHLQNLLKA